MRQGTRTAVTVGVLVVILLVGAGWGWMALTKPLPGKAEVTPCVDTPVAEGENVRPGQVVVSVLNAGSREGLAGRTMRLFTEQGFVAGDSGNAPDRADVDVAQIWTREPRNPAVLLVASRLGRNVEIVLRNATGIGVTVIVGDEFVKLVKGRKAVRARSDVVVCSPPT